MLTQHMLGIEDYSQYHVRISMRKHSPCSACKGWVLRMSHHPSPNILAPSRIHSSVPTCLLYFNRFSGQRKGPEFQKASGRQKQSSSRPVLLHTLPLSLGELYGNALGGFRVRGWLVHRLTCQQPSEGTEDGGKPPLPGAIVHRLRVLSQNIPTSTAGLRTDDGWKHQNEIIQSGVQRISPSFRGKPEIGSRPKDVYFVFYNF